MKKIIITLFVAWVILMWMAIFIIGLFGIEK